MAMAGRNVAARRVSRQQQAAGSERGRNAAPGKAAEAAFPEG
jgi:hypothetical protein